MDSTSDSQPGLRVGDRVEVVIGPVAHGGHCIAHSHGKTIFVRHAIPGERALIVITGRNARILRADALEILNGGADRVQRPCEWSGPGGCGGCDFQHVRLSTQREWKSDVLKDSLRRFGALDDTRIGVLDTRVRPLPGPEDGLGWRTRVAYAQAPDGSWGLHAHRSKVIIPVKQCALGMSDASHPGPATGNYPARVHQRSWKVTPEMFWQPHFALPEHLVDAVLEFGAPAQGQTWWDLYSGAGLISAFLGEHVGGSGQVEAVEQSADAMRCARRSLHDLPQVRLHQADVVEWLRLAEGPVDGVVLDPPRSGAGPAVLDRLVALGPLSIVYVACDPVALGRDTRILEDQGYRMDMVRAFDAFPMTHHFETVALFTLGGPARRTAD